MLAELGQAVLINVLDPVTRSDCQRRTGEIATTDPIEP